MSRSKHFILTISMICSLCCLFNCSKSPTGGGPYTPPPGSTSNGYFIVSNPVSGSSYAIGAYDSIVWTSTGAITGSYVSIYLYNDQNRVATITTYTLNSSGVYRFYIPNVGSGNKYHIKIQCYTDTTQYDFGGYFTLYSGYSGSYSIQNPVDSTVWQAGNSYTIQWQTTGSPGTYVSLQLYKDTVLYSTLTTLTSNTGSYTWTISGAIASGSNYRIKVSSYYDIGLYAFSDSFSIKGLDPDIYEFDNVRDSARVLQFDSTQKHTITMGDTDWVQFNADSGYTYVVRCNDSTSGILLYFYYANETTTSYTISSYSNGSVFNVWPCVRTGAYHVKIYPYYSGYTGKYTLKVTKIDPSTVATFSNPTSVSTWSAGSSYSVNWTPDTGLFGAYVNLYIYKGNQLVYTIYTYTGNSGSYTASLPAGLATGSDYRIRIANYSYPQVYGYSQYFTISGMAPDAFEFDNVRDSAKTLTLGVSQQHNHTYNDTDWVKFSADSGSRYVVMSTGAAGYRVYAYLYYGAQTSYTAYFYSTGSGSVLYNSPWTCTLSGTYYLRVFSYYSGYTGSYYLKVVKMDSTAVSFSSPDSGAVWSTGSTYTVNWSADTALFSNTLYLYLYKGNQSVASIASGTANDGTQSWTIPTTTGLATGSDYRIWIANYSNSSIAAYSRPFSISGLTPDAYESDDSAGAAKSISTDGTPQNRTLTYGDYDWISFTAEKDSIYVILGSGGSTVYMYLYLYSNPAGSYLNYTYGYSPKLLWTCPASGNYYLRVTPSTYGNYSIYVKKYTLASSVTFINPTAPSTWTTGSPYSIQWIVDTVLFGPTVQLQLTVDITPLYSITTYTTNNGTYSWTPPAGLATGSQYRIKLSSYSYANVSGYSSAFTISGIAPDAYEPDNSVAAAHAIATDGVAEGHTISIGDKDWYSFSATANLLYLLQSHGAIRPALYLYNTDGATPLTSANTGYTDTIAAVVWFCPASGTYYFRDTAGGTYGYGSYQTSVGGYDSAAYALSVSAPAAGATLTTGLADTIRWSSTVSVGGSVDIFLYDSTGIKGTVVANVTNSGSYIWTTGTLTSGTATAGDTYYVRVISRISSSIFGNSGVFTIQ